MELTRKRLEQLKRLLRSRHEFLLAETGDEVAKSRGEPYREIAGSVADSGDESVADLITDLDSAEISRDLEEINAIEAAQARIAAATYGACAECGVAIDFERLRVNPVATRCLDCQRVHEKTYAHPDEPQL